MKQNNFAADIERKKAPIAGKIPEKKTRKIKGKTDSNQKKKTNKNSYYTKESAGILIRSCHIRFGVNQQV